MTAATDLLTDAFGRIHGTVHRVVEELDQEALAHRPSGTGNSIAWLVWHLTRVQDDHVADVADTEQVWTTGGWAERFGLPLGVGDTGYGHASHEVEALGSVAGDLLTGYFDAVHAQTLEYLGGLRDDDLDRIVDTRWDPPVTLGVRLVSVADDDAQHAGQAAYVRGLLGLGVSE
jgi:uncharacterized damage-inducible protein DinB